MGSSFKPQTYEDLLRLFYGPNLNGKKKDYPALRKYMNNYRAQYKSPQNEELVSGLFSKIGNVEKIKKSQDKYTYDFKIESEKILIEVTSINSDIQYTFVPPFSDEYIIDRLTTAITHIVMKDSSNYPGYVKGGVIVYDTVSGFRTFPSFWEKVENLLPKSKENLEKKWDYLVIIQEPSADLIKGSSMLTIPALIILKDEKQKKNFIKIFNGKNHRFLVIGE